MTKAGDRVRHRHFACWEANVPLQIGLVGFPNAGKSTLFNALTRAGAAVAKYPFTTIEPNHGVTPVPDERLERLAALVQPERVVPAAIEFVDIAGLVKGAHRGEGLGNQFLGHIRNVDAVALVTRCFTDPDVPHVAPVLDPASDIGVILLELSLADMATVDKRVEKVKAQAKAAPAAHADELAYLERLRLHLAQGLPAHRWPQRDEARHHDLGLLTDKEFIYVANVDEASLPSGGAFADAVRDAAQRDQAEAVVVCAKVEAELAEWPRADAEAYRAELGLKRSAVLDFIQASYRLLNLITFFTIVGGREVHAWPIRRGTTAWLAAGKVHSDMQHGFIRAEVIPCDLLLSEGSLAAAREKGHLRTEGRDYVVHDGDVIHFRFSA